MKKILKSMNIWQSYTQTQSTQSLLSAMVGLYTVSQICWRIWPGIMWADNFPQKWYWQRENYPIKLCFTFSRPLTVQLHLVEHDNERTEFLAFKCCTASRTARWHAIATTCQDKSARRYRNAEFLTTEVWLIRLTRWVRFNCFNRSHRLQTHSVPKEGGNQFTHPLNGPFSGTTQVNQYQKGKTNLDFTEARDSEWQWHQLGYASLHLAPDRQPRQHPTTLFFYRPDALPAAQPTA